MNMVIAFFTILTLLALNDFVDDVKYRWKMDKIIDDQKTREILAKTDVAVLVLDATEEMGTQEQDFLALLQEKKLPFVVVKNKVDLVKGVKEEKKDGGKGTEKGIIKLYSIN